MSAADYQRPHYAPGVPAVVALPTQPLSTVLDDAAKRFPQRIAVDFLGTSITYAQLHAQVQRAAEALRRLGVRKGDVVASILPNCPQHLVLAYATWRIGAVLAEHNPLAPSSQIEEQLKLHGGKLIIGWEKSLAQLDKDINLRDYNVYAVNMTSALPRHLQAALRLPVKAARAKREEMRAPVPSWIGSWDRLVASSPALPADTALPDVNDVATLLHTGGTTGTPKAVKLTHMNLGSNTAMGLAWAGPHVKDGQEVFYSVLPYFHAFGLTLSMLCAVALAATQVVLPKFSVSLVIEAWKRQPCTFFPGVPVIFDRLAKAAANPRPGQVMPDFTSCSIALCGAAATPREVAAAWEELTGHYLIEGYGMTETSPIIMGNPITDERRPGALGVPFPSTDILLVDPEDPDPSRPVPRGEVGEIAVRGPQVFAGYLNNPEETAQVMLEGGWLRTGDLARIDTDDFYVMTDRRKELIISGGFNIYPTEVEAAVRSMPGVEDVAVVGLPEQSGNESVVAAIVAQAGANITLEEVRAWAEKHIAHYALPRQIAIVQELPRSQIGKVMRRVLREELLNARESAGQAATKAQEAAGQAAVRAQDTASKAQEAAAQAAAKAQEAAAKAQEVAGQAAAKAQETAAKAQEVAGQAAAKAQEAAAKAQEAAKKLKR